MTPRRFFLDGVARWSRAPNAAEAANGERPAPTLLGANERRRAPASVLMALHVAEQAVAQSGLDATTLASVFTSAHGDLAIVDALCSTLAADPQLLSPTRFHHSVHNAPSGYWAIAAASRAPSSAIAAYRRSFAAGLMEAAAQCSADARPVLLVACDTHARGALASVNRSRGLLAVALVLSPRESKRSSWAIEWSLRAGTAAPPRARDESLRALEDNAMADALPFVEALSAEAPSRLELSASPALALALTLQPLARNA
jgi:hypothetical protein